MLAKLPSATWTRNVWSLIFGATLLGACFAKAPFLERGPLRRLGTVSFSLYLLHPPIMAGLGKLQFGAWVASLTPQPHARFALALLTTVSIVWLASEASFRLIEARGISLGRRLGARMRGAGAALARPRSAPPMAERPAHS